MRRLLAIIVSLALALAMGVMSAKPAAAVDPPWDTFPQAQRTEVSPEEVVFSPTQTGKVRVTITTRFTESSDWVYKSLGISSRDGNFYLDRNEVVGNLREVVISGDVYVDHARGYGWAHIYPRYVWKSAPNTQYSAGAYSYYQVYGQSRVTLAGPARINPGTSLTLTGKLECFLRTNYGVPTNDYPSIDIQFREEGASDWTSMGNATYNRDTGAYRYFNIAVGATGDWRAVNYADTCTSSASPVLHVVAGDAPPPEPPATSNAPAMRVSAKTHSTVSLSWTAPTQPGGTITGYRLGWESENGLPVPEWSKVYAKPSNPFVMTNLAPESDYSMWIEAITAAGTGDRTTVDVTTNAAPPPPAQPVTKVPTKPRPTKVTRAARSAKLYWAAPASNGGAGVNAYQVKRGTGAKVLGAGARSYNFTGLRPLTRHTVYVRAHNSVGWGPWAGVAFYTKAPAAKAYRSCAALNYDYPHGVGKPGKKDKGTGVTNYYRSTKTYKKNDGRVKSKGQYDLDRDNDGIACEKR